MGRLGPSVHSHGCTNAQAHPASAKAAALTKGTLGSGTFQHRTSTSYRTVLRGGGCQQPLAYFMQRESPGFSKLGLIIIHALGFHFAFEA